MKNLRSENEIMAQWQGEPSKPLVSICCAAYNHEPYIEDALEGFLIQKTDFPFEILIHDDASTDRTADIIREYEARYPKLIKPIYQTKNQYCKGNKPSQLNRKRAKGKYIAFCEGDDYWTSPKKLQKQVFFLKSNLNYSFCFTRFYTYNQKNMEILRDKNENYFLENQAGKDFDFKMFHDGWHIGTQTILFRSNALNEKHSLNRWYRDVFLIADLLHAGKGYCLKEFMAVYRKHDNGIYTGLNKIEKAEIGAKIYQEIYSKYNKNKYLRLKYLKYQLYYIVSLFRYKRYKKSTTELLEMLKECQDIKMVIALHHSIMINIFLGTTNFFSKKFK